MKWFIRIIIALICVLIVASLIISGLPTDQRKQKFDELRLKHLQMIQSQLFYYAQVKEGLPESLNDLTKNPQGFTIPKDPEKNTEYEYHKKSNEEFELCGEFTTSNEREQEKYLKSPTPYYPVVNQDWKHGVGRVCFIRKIDKDFLKSTQPGMMRPY